MIYLQIVYIPKKKTVNRQEGSNNMGLLEWGDGGGGGGKDTEEALAKTQGEGSPLREDVHPRQTTSPTSVHMALV